MHVVVGTDRRVARDHANARDDARREHRSREGQASLVASPWRCDREQPIALHIVELDARRIRSTDQRPRGAFASRGLFILNPGALRAAISRPRSDPENRLDPVDLYPLRLWGRPPQASYLRRRVVRMPRMWRM